MKRTGYLRHIDGLRAWAIILVVLFHYSHLKGGFIGVDVFFVISGFLITTQLYGEISEGRFSFLSFYAKRIRRLLPPLAIVLSATWFASWAILFHDDYVQLGQHLKASSLLFMNFQLQAESGYFDHATQLKPLMHLWSLSVEEQFYFLWPILLVVIANLNRKRLLVVLCVFAMASFAYNLYLASHNQAADFYNFFSRFWEIGLGGILAIGSQYLANLKFYESRLFAKLAQALGVVLILSGALFYREFIVFPGFYALLPTTGALLIILSGDKSTFFSRYFLTSAPVVLLGQMSYSLYLWHWPTLSLLKIFRAGEVSQFESYAAILFSLLASALTYYFIEKPTRRISVNSVFARRAFVTGGITILICFAYLGELTFQDKIKEHLSGLQAVPYNYQEELVGYNPCTFSAGTNFNPASQKKCEVKKWPDRPTIVLLGDSHAIRLSSFLAQMLDASRLNLVFYSAMYCAPGDLDSKKKGCPEYNRYVQQKIVALHPSALIVAENYILWQKEARENDSRFETTSWMHALGKFQAETGIPVLAVGQIPTWKNSLPAVLNSNFVRSGLPLPLRTYVGVTSESLAMDNNLKALVVQNGLTYFSLRDRLCDLDGCLVRVGPLIPQDLIVFDYGHLSSSGAKFILDHGLLTAILQVAATVKATKTTQQHSAQRFTFTSFAVATAQSMNGVVVSAT